MSEVKITKEVVPEYEIYVDSYVPGEKSKKIILVNQELDKVTRTIEGRVMIKDGFLYVEELWDAVDKAIAEDEKLGVKIHRKHPAKRLVNKFSGQYLSPTMIKGWYFCPASQVLQSFQPYQPNAFTSMGTSIHGILEDFYKLKQEERTLDKLDKFTDEWITKGEHDTEFQVNYIKEHIQGFKEIGDYLYPNKPMEHNDLVCFPEYFAKVDNLKPLGVSLQLPVYNLMDRLDIRDEGIFIIDYKSGKYFKDETFTMDGYLPQLISYKWAIEEQYGEEVKGAYILTPGISNKIHDMDINSLQNQSMYVERILKYIDEVQKASNTNSFPVDKPEFVDKIIENNKWDVQDLGNGNKMVTIKYTYETYVEPSPDNLPSKDK